MSDSQSAHPRMTAHAVAGSPPVSSPIAHGYWLRPRAAPSSACAAPAGTPIGNQSSSGTRVFGQGRGGQPHRMAELNPLRYLARAAPKPLDGALAMAANVTSDFA